MNVLSLFSGIGGLDLGLERAGMTVVGQVEIDPWCRKVLAKHWPEVPRHDDVRTAVGWWLVDRRAPVHLVAGGPPCQPVSTSGRQLAQADPRWQWPAMAAVVEAVHPAWVIVENVPGLLGLGLADVLGDLARLGYRARAGWISACEMGAPYPRKRLFVLAHADGFRCQARRPERGDACPPDGRGSLAEAVACDWWASEPGVGRVVHGLPAQMDRLRGLGNAVVPQVAEHVGRLIMTAAAA